MDGLRLSFSDWKYLDAYLVWIYEGPPQTFGEEMHNSYFTFWLIEEGHVRVRGGGSDVEAGKGQWVLLPPGTSRRRFSDSLRILSIHFEARWITGKLLLEFEGPIVEEASANPSWRKLCGPMLRLVRKHYPDAYNRLPQAVADFGVYADVLGSFQRWLAAVSGCLLRREGVTVHLPQHKDSRAMDMRRWLDARAIEHGFQLQELAAAFALSPAQLNRIFIADFSVTPKRYFEQRRLSFARAALSSSSQSMKEISYLAGFGYQSEFTAWFKKHSGLAPSEYRMQAKGLASVD
ncbi:AraC family transcriptional regulator [Coraliomargarita algicola]|uniref:AraC family transcriptional regulator n=1 Tax=Coraliomargarita algicola TaxID=3092156 RepID=A0ABZ0RMM8_9BACT|nr:AraC family transcriptional regulator [Coraliomargarita sp. J2-16]WPJ96762.1 AraC family transcriptional regulator [Coraliomargarita sp. J2-16]